MGNGSPARLWRSLAILVVVAGLVAVGRPAAAGGPVERPLAAPQVAAVSPSSGAIRVAVSSAIQVRFSEAMNNTTVSQSIQPAISVATWWPAPDLLVLTPVPPGLTNCTVYRVQVSGRDLDEGLGLSPGAVPNPWSFMTACANPFLIQTVPADGARSVLPNASIVVTFSEPIDQLSYSFVTAPPSSTRTNFDASRTVLTVQTSLQPGMTYTALVSARDDDGNPLNSSLIPNPWRFTVNEAPTIPDFTVSDVGCLESGSNLTLDWSMVDDTDPAADLEVFISYLDRNSTWRSILGPARNFASPASFVWTLPFTDVDTRIRLRVNDTVGASAVAEVSGIRIDSAPPRVLSTTPANGTANVSIQSSIVVVFSESMNVTATEAALSVEPALQGAALGWVNANRALTIDPITLSDRTRYRVTIGGTALDTCAAGRPLGAPVAFEFRTENLPSQPPANIEATSTGETWVELAWDPVLTFVNGNPIPANAAIRYVVLRSETDADQGREVGNTTGARFRDEGLRPSTNYIYRVLAIVDGKSSGFTVLTVRTRDPFLATPAGLISAGLLAAVGASAFAFLLQRRWAARRRAAKYRTLLEEIQGIARGVLRLAGEPDSEARRREVDELRTRLRDVLRPERKREGEAFTASRVYEILAQSLTPGAAADHARGADLLRRQLGPLADQLEKFPAAYEPIRNAEGTLLTFADLPDFARRAIMLEYVRGFEAYVRLRIDALTPGGPTPGLSRGPDGRSSSELLHRVDRDPEAFIARVAAWTEARPVIVEALELRDVIEDLDVVPPTLGRIRGAVFLALISCRGLFRRTTDRGAARGT